VINIKLRPIVVALASAMVIQGCATNSGQNKSSIAESFKQTFNNDDPCANSKRNIGVALGAVAGAIVGSQVSGDKNKLIGVIIGAAAGAGIGGFIGSEVDKRHCEIAKIQKKYGADIQVTPISMTSSANQNPQSMTARAIESNSTVTNSSVGLSVNVVDKLGDLQFASGSDELSPKLREMFVEIANQYKIPTGADESSQKASEILKARRVLLIGHTDDTGSSKFNAELSERRAKNVAKVFKSAGVPEAQIYYQGAGETLPFADNATEEGRTLNRRVEIVDLSDEDNFKLYLQNRRVNAEYYRPVENLQASNMTSLIVTTEKPQLDTNVVTISKKKEEKSVAKNGSDSKKSTLAKETVRTWIDFGGLPATSENTTVNLGDVAKSKPKFTLISSAQASDMRTISSCNMDRPRESGAVKSLKGDEKYATNEHLPGLNGRSWQDTVGGNLVVLNRVAVLSDGATPANSPELKVYVKYNPVKNRNPKPDIVISPPVNTYQGSNGLIYRVFAQGNHGLQCMDILMPSDSSGVSKAGKLVYGDKSNALVADFKPKMIR